MGTITSSPPCEPHRAAINALEKHKQHIHPVGASLIAEAQDSIKMPHHLPNFLVSEKYPQH